MAMAMNCYTCGRELKKDTLIYYGAWWPVPCLIYEDDLCHQTVPERFLKIEGMPRAEGWGVVRVISLQNNLILALAKENK